MRKKRFLFLHLSNTIFYRKMSTSGFLTCRHSLNSCEASYEYNVENAPWYSTKSSDPVKECHNLATRTILIDAECTVTEPVRDLVL